MSRIRQVRDVIWERQKDERRQRLRVEEMKVQAIIGAVHAAAGNKRGVAGARRFRLLPRESVTPTPEYIAQRFPVDEGAGGLITPEQILAEQKRLGLVTA